ncbi:arsenate reductase/protein-tyrosine-phosphatase family protein [Kineosporia babensis]|uniref:Phosphotyrosine protein phosphatase I domain-containing protein n=1 Tax=Kineosporia babensis TaxID=499548 RepID=A0A9X1NA71_9ACTN|nr:hypothetical protein [Kineosporia babensis]MCD5310066.1 hypothetical protein [Kineosporia babensis]
MGPKVLLVCTANICRSPAAERLLAGRLGGAVEFSSRGTRSVTGAGICDFSGSWVETHGGLVRAHESRQLEVADIRAATMILTASQAQRGRVIEMRPSAQVRTFTLLHAARTAQWLAASGRTPPRDVDLADRLLWLVEELDANRGSAPRALAGPTADDEDELPDPHRGGRHPQVFARLQAAVEDLCAPLLFRGPALRRDRARLRQKTS